MREQASTVFVSYSYLDEAVFRAVKHELSGSSITVWSIRDVDAGESWAERVLAELEGARVYVLLISADYLGSKSALFELGIAIGRAFNHEAVVIPVLLGDLNLPPQLAKMKPLDCKNATPLQVARRVHQAVLHVDSASESVDGRGEDRLRPVAFRSVPLVNVITESDWSELTERLLAYATDVVHGDRKGKPPQAYVLSAVSQLLDSKALNAPGVRRSLFYRLCIVIDSMVHSDDRGSRSSRKALGTNDDLDRQIERYETMPSEEVRTQLHRHGVDPAVTVKSVMAAVRMRQQA